MSLEIRKEITIKGAAISEDPILYFDNIGPATSLSAITVDSFGGGNSGDMIFQTAQSGVLNEAMRIGQLGQVAIGTSSVDTSAVFQVDSLIRGFLPPRTPDPETNIVTPANGLMAYDSTDNELQYYNGTSWVSLTSGSGYLPLAGGTMSGDIDMDGNAIDFGGILGSITNPAGELTIQSFKNTTIDANGQTYDFSDGSAVINITGSGMTPGSLALNATDGTIKATASAIESTLYLSDLPTTNRQWLMPDADGTVALTSDLGDYLPLAGGTMVGNITSLNISVTDGNYIEWNTGVTGSRLTSGITTGLQLWELPDATGTIALLSDIPASQDLQSVMDLGSTATGLLTSVDISTSADVNISATSSMITLDAMDINVGNTGSVTNTYVKANDLVEIESSIAVNIIATDNIILPGTGNIGTPATGYVLTAASAAGELRWTAPASAMRAEYTALLTQVGTSAPTESVLNDTLTGGTWSYSSVGHYHYTKVGAFTNVNKVEVRIEAHQFNFFTMSNNAFNMMSASRLNNDTILVKTANVGYVGLTGKGLTDPTLAGTITDFLVDDILSNTPITIRVWS